MADMLHATASEIRAELRTLDARRARLRKLLAIALEDEGKPPETKAEDEGKPPETKAEDKAPETKPEGGARPDARPEVPPVRDVPPPAKAEPFPRRGR